MANRSGTPDPASTLALLWRVSGPERGARGPKASRSIDGVVAAAIELADSGGLAAVSMRRVADVLEMAPMSIYTYVPGKAELIHLMVDAVHLAMPRPSLAGQSLRERLTTIAEGNRVLLTRHSWIASVHTSRPSWGPGSMAKYEHELSAFLGLGLDDATIRDALAYLLGFVASAARAAQDVRAAALDDALRHEEWRVANAPLLATVFDARRYPHAARIGCATSRRDGADNERAFAFGLARTLDALGLLVERRARGGDDLDAPGEPHR